VTKKSISRRVFLEKVGGAVAGFALLGPWAGRVVAAGTCFPSGTTVRWIVPFSAGGGYTLYSRILEPFLEDAVGAEIVVENHPGAGGATGSTKLFKATPNGRTIGIVNAGGILMSGIAGEVDFTIERYTILGRVVDTRQVICVGKPTFDKGIRTIEDVLQVKEPLIWGVTGPGSNEFFGAAVLSHLLGIKRRFLSGYPGSTEYVLAAAKGEIDLVESTFSSLISPIEAGDLVPLALVGPKVPEHAIFEKKRIPSVMEIAKMVGANASDVLGAAQVTAAGRVVVGPPGIPADVTKCLSNGLYEAMTNPGLKAIADGARRPIDPIGAEEARRALLEASVSAKKFKKIWQQAVKELGT